MSFIISFIILNIIILKIEKRKYIKENERIEYIANYQIGKIQSTIDKYLNNADLWGNFVVENKQNIDYFYEIAEIFYKYDPIVRSIQLAPNGVVTHIYPQKGNEGGYVDLFSDPLRRKEAEYAKKTGKMTVSGPVNLYQGGTGLIARKPIYIENSSGKKEFWGFSIVILNTEEIFKLLKIDNIEKEGYEYKLWKIDPNTNKKQIILESTNKPFDKPTQISFEVYNSKWTFSLESKNEIGQRLNYIYSVSLATLASILIGLVVWLWLKINQQNKMLTRYSYEDSLTRLYNQRKLFTILARYEKENRVFGIIYIDLDGFKAINDTYGHDIGDKFLYETATRLEQSIKGIGLAFRIGGDEFVVVIKGDYEKQFYKDTIKKISKAFKEDIVFDNIKLNIKGSFGFARFPQDTTNIEELIKKADKEMYEIKRGKKLTSILNMKG